MEMGIRRKPALGEPIIEIKRNSKRLVIGPRIGVSDAPFLHELERKILQEP
jgi:hypothetical protein